MRDLFRRLKKKGMPKAKKPNEKGSGHEEVMQTGLFTDTDPRFGRR